MDIDELKKENKRFHGRSEYTIDLVLDYVEKLEKRIVFIEKNGLGHTKGHLATIESMRVKQGLKINEQLEEEKALEIIDADTPK